MAASFVRYDGVATVAGATVLTVPAGTTAIIIGFNIANISTSQVTVSVDIGGTWKIKDAPVPAGSALSPLDGKDVILPGETITIYSNTEGAIQAQVSVLEKT